MIAVPADAPATTPFDEPMVAAAVLLLLHVPPGLASASVAVEPEHIVVLPVMAAMAETLVTAVTRQPPAVYVIVAEPAFTAVSIPVAEPTDATAALLLLHVPPVVVLPSVAIEPAHSEVVPVIAPGAAFTLMVAVR